MKKILTFMLITAALVAASTCYAQTVEIKSDSLSGKAGQGYTLLMYSSDGEERIVCIDESEMSGNGELKFTFEFAEKSGKYNYVITSNAGDQSQSGVFMYTDESELESALQELKKAVQSSDNAGDEVQKCLDKYSNVFLLDSEFEINQQILKIVSKQVYSDFASDIKEAFDNGGISLEQLRSIYRKRMLICAVSSGSSELIAEIDMNYFGYIGNRPAEVEVVYKTLESAARLNAAEIEKGSYKSADEYIGAHSGAVAIAAINAAKSYLTVGEITDKLNSAANLGFPSLNKEDRAEVLSEITKKRPFSSVAGFKTAVGSAVSSLGKSPSDKPGYSTGGGGGGGGLSYRPSIQPPSENVNEESQPFHDIDSVSWAKEAILKLFEKGIISGRENGEYAPSDNVTREEFVKILVLAYSISSNGDVSFEDVLPDAWYTPFVKAAAGSGIVKGIGDRNFGTGSFITREDACVMLARAAAYSTGNEAAEDNFNDSADISDYAREAVGILAGKKIINGMADGSFMPKKTITRAETAVMIYRSLVGVN